jgi:hypothetical protein
VDYLPQVLRLFSVGALQVFLTSMTLEGPYEMDPSHSGHMAFSLNKLLRG